GPGGPVLLRRRKPPPWPTAQDAAGIAAAIAAGAAALVPRPPLRLCRRWQLCHARPGSVGGTASPAVDVFESLLRQRQPLRTATARGPRPEATGPSPAEREETAGARGGRATDPQAAAPERRLVRGRPSGRGGRDGHRSVVSSGGRVGGGLVGM